MRSRRKIRGTNLVWFGLVGCLVLVLMALSLWGSASPAGAVSSRATNPECDWPDATVTFSGTYTDTDENSTDAGGPLGASVGGDASYSLTLHWTSVVTGPMAGDQPSCFPPDQATLEAERLLLVHTLA